MGVGLIKWERSDKLYKFLKGLLEKSLALGQKKKNSKKLYNLRLKCGVGYLSHSKSNGFEFFSGKFLYKLLTYRGNWKIFMTNKQTLE